MTGKVGKNKTPTLCYSFTSTVFFSLVNSHKQHWPRLCVLLWQHPECPIMPVSIICHCQRSSEVAPLLHRSWQTCLTPTQKVCYLFLIASLFPQSTERPLSLRQWVSTLKEENKSSSACVNLSKPKIEQKKQQDKLLGAVLGGKETWEEVTADIKILYVVFCR